MPAPAAQGDASSLSPTAMLQAYLRSRGMPINAQNMQRLLEANARGVPNDPNSQNVVPLPGLVSDVPSADPAVQARQPRLPVPPQPSGPPLAPGGEPLSSGAGPAVVRSAPSSEHLIPNYNAQGQWIGYTRPGRDMASLMAAKGRNHDTIAAHLTPGEIVVPPHAQTPEVKQALARAFHASRQHPARYVAGHPAQRINPGTGAPEFDGSDVGSFTGPASDSATTAAGWTPGPASAPAATWDTSVWGNWGAPAAGSSTPSWTAGSQAFSIDPSANSSLVQNYLTWPGSGGNVPVLGAGSGGASNVVTDATNISSSPFWTATGTPGQYTPTQAGLTYAQQQQAAYQAGNTGIPWYAALPFALTAAGIGGGFAAGGAAADAATGAADLGAGEASATSAAYPIATSGDVLSAAPATADVAQVTGDVGATAAAEDVAGAGGLGAGGAGATGGVGDLAAAGSSAITDPANTAILTESVVPDATAAAADAGTISLAPASPTVSGLGTGLEGFGGTGSSLGSGLISAPASATVSTTAPEAGGGWLSQIGNELGIGGSMSTGSALNAAKLGLTALGAGKTIAGMFGNPLSKDPGYNQLVSQANALAGQQQSLMQPLTTGQLPPQFQAVVNQATESAKAAIKQRYASLNLSGSTMEQQDLNNVDQQALTTTANIASQMFSAGMSEAQLSNSIWSGILGENVQLDEQTGQAITNLAAALGNSYVRPTGAGSTPTTTTVPTVSP